MMIIVNWNTTKLRTNIGAAIIRISAIRLAAREMLSAFRDSSRAATTAGLRTVSCTVLMLGSPGSNALNLRPAEQTGGPEYEDGDDHRQCDRQLQFIADARDVGAGEVLQHPDHEAAGHRARRARQPAEHRANEA